MTTTVEIVRYSGLFAVVVKELGEPDKRFVGPDEQGLEYMEAECLCDRIERFNRSGIRELAWN